MRRSLSLVLVAIASSLLLAGPVLAEEQTCRSKIGAVTIDNLHTGGNTDTGGGDTTD